MLQKLYLIQILYTVQLFLYKTKMPIRSLLTTFFIQLDFLTSKSSNFVYKLQTVQNQLTNLKKIYLKEEQYLWARTAFYCGQIKILARRQ